MLPVIGAETFLSACSCAPSFLLGTPPLCSVRAFPPVSTHPPHPRLTPTRSFNGFFTYYCSLAYNSLCAKIFNPNEELQAAETAAATSLGVGGGLLGLFVVVLIGTVLCVRRWSGRNGKVWYWYTHGCGACARDGCGDLGPIHPPVADVYGRYNANRGTSGAPADSAQSEPPPHGLELPLAVAVVVPVETVYATAVPAAQNSARPIRACPVQGYPVGNV